jgi:hypothetical protein
VERIASAFGIAAHVEIDLGARSSTFAPRARSCRSGASAEAGLVAGEQRLELLDWPSDALPHLKAAGCFTEIIQHRTRLFVPRAAPSRSWRDSRLNSGSVKRRRGRRPSAGWA